MTSQEDKCREFSRLHQQAGAFVIPNPWDVGSARLLQGLGFKAIATTSAGLALSLGKADGEVTLEEKLAHCAQIASATAIPVNVDFEDGFADDPESVARNVLRVAATGVAGCSIEDFSRTSKTLYDIGQAVERVRAAAEALASLGMPFQLTARSENLFRGAPDLDDTIRRLQAYEEAGANVLYAPGIASLEDLRRVTSAIASPFNVLAVFFRGASVEDFAQAGAKRISVGSTLAWTALGPVIKAGREMLEQGTFTWTSEMPSGAEVKRLLA